MSVLHLFEGYGIELEYMLVRADSLDVAPVCDRVLQAAGGGFEAEVERGPCAWSNELALHVLELKTNGPAPGLAGLAEMFQGELGVAGELAGAQGARLLPGGMHPWMDPARELVLWPHEYGPVYRAYDRIFGCRGHGWANLQSMHVNLPFADDAEFAALHAALRVLLPLMPGLAASSPFVEGRRAPQLCHRMEVYRTNSARIPEATGLVVPEPVSSREEHRERVLDPLYRALAPHDPEGVLHHEWASSRGVLARFDRMALEVRVLDTQECPRADLAVAALISAATRALVEERWVGRAQLDALATEELAAVLAATTHEACRAEVRHPGLLEALGLPAQPTPVTEVWGWLASQFLVSDPAWDREWRPPFEHYLARGSLAHRLAEAAGPAPSRARLGEIYGELAACLEEGRLFG